jgi:hypothetical protein
LCGLKCLGALASATVIIRDAKSRLVTVCTTSWPGAAGDDNCDQLLYRHTGDCCCNPNVQLNALLACTTLANVATASAAHPQVRPGHSGVECKDERYTELLLGILLDFGELPQAYRICLSQHAPAPMHVSRHIATPGKLLAVRICRRFPRWSSLSCRPNLRRPK